MSKNRRILFLTGTRADFGKIKSLLLALEGSDFFEIHLLVTGMHLLKQHGATHREIDTLGLKNVYKVTNDPVGRSLDQILAQTIAAINPLIEKVKPDLVITHGDRTEALALAVCGAFNNILVGHIEGGEVSGTIDESIRHAISKLSHLHFASNQQARTRLIQLGENPGHIHIIGSPNLDILSSSNLPDLESVRRKYNITFKRYAIVLYHPVTTEIDKLLYHAHALIKALSKSRLNYIIIHSNNDPGSEVIFQSYQSIVEDPRFIFYPSLKLEDFLTLMKNSLFLIGNSSAGVHEAPFFGVPSINIGTRQNNRANNPEIRSVHSTQAQTSGILRLIKKFSRLTRYKPVTTFGDGKSGQKFIEILKQDIIWRTPIQKRFYDLPNPI